MLRCGVAAFFVVMGGEKFSSGPADPWVAIFEEIGLGQWFRYFTGVSEIGGALLYVFPATCAIGTAILASTMLGAAIVHIMIRHSVAASLYPAIILIAAIAIAIRRPDVPPATITRRRSSGPDGPR